MPTRTRHNNADLAKCCQEPNKSAGLSCAASTSNVMSGMGGAGVAMGGDSDHHGYPKLGSRSLDKQNLTTSKLMATAIAIHVP